MTRARVLTVACLIWLLSTLPRSDPAFSDGTQPLDRVLADIAALSGPEFEGRQAGAESDRRSAQYVADALRASSLTVSIQQEPLPVIRIGPGATFAVSRPNARDAELGRDWLPVLDSPSVALNAPVVVAGYGISDPAAGIDDYDGRDVRGRIVLFQRGQPETYKGRASHADKERAAREHGAAAFLTMTPRVVTGYEARRGGGPEPTALYSRPPGETTLPGAWIHTDLGETLIADAAREGGVRVQLRWSSTMTDGTLMNVTAVLRGRDPVLREETIVVGAHRDHFGRQATLLFPGADDNASGTAILLETARALAHAPPKRSVAFVSFSGEERGLLGSRLYVREPPVPLDRTIAMINLDHAGVGNGRLTVGLNKVDGERAHRAAASAGLGEILDLFGFFPGSDHVPFKEAGVPTAAIVTSGVHPHFHRPTDTAETLKLDQIETAMRYVIALVRELAEN